MGVSAIIQARFSSERLPGKVMMDVCGQPMLAHIVWRLQMTKGVDHVIIATSQDEKDDVIYEMAKRLGVMCFRGSLEDVLDRYIQAGRTMGSGVILRATGDNPLIDPDITERLIKKHIAFGADYTFAYDLPLGVSPEVVNLRVLEAVHSKAKELHYREHVTYYIKENPNEFKIEILEPDPHLRRPEIRLTVDTLEDLTLVRKIYEELYIEGEVFSTSDVLSLLDKYPKLLEINKGIKQKAV